MTMLTHSWGDPLVYLVNSLGTSDSQGRSPATNSINSTPGKFHQCLLDALMTGRSPALSNQGTWSVP